MSSEKKNVPGDDPFTDGCILFFVKYPEKGGVKSRLSVDLKELSVVELYRCFVLDLLSMLNNLAIAFQVCYFPKVSGKQCKAWLGDHYSYMAQQGKDLGARMSKSFSRAFSKGFRRVVVIGSDSPDLPSGFIKEAFLCLKTNDSVLGPTTDGGYYLIGFRDNTFFPQAFENITWSTNTVYRDTRHILGKAGHKTHLLPLWSDVDTLDDLKGLVQRSEKTGFSASKTMDYLLHSDLPWVTRKKGLHAS